ncbi:MAG: toxin-antitoxin system HicB family antitoxin [Pyrinomonadaceae bacterium]
MTMMNVEVPDALYQRLAEVAAKEGVMVESLISSTLGEKIAALQTEDYLRLRAARGSREKFERVVARVPDVEPEAHDRLE